MRRSTGIQALEVHVLMARSTAEAKAIVNSIRNVCSKYKYDQTQATRVFQYQPFADEQNLDIITDLNTSSNAVTSTKNQRSEKKAAQLDSSIGMDSSASKSHTSMSSQKSTTLFNRIRKNLRDSSRHSKKEKPPTAPSKKSKKSNEI